MGNLTDLVVSREQIDEQIDEWVKTNLENDFTFRPHQKETIGDILENVLSHKERYYAVEAPTGTGKSLINIIVGGILEDYYSVQTYILVSDLFLWEQYNTFLKQNPDINIAILKGQTGNYHCALNGEDMKNADCRMAGLSWSALFNRYQRIKNGYECAETCEYVQARIKALKCKTVIMTYQLFLFIMNNPKYNTDSHGAPIFKPGEVILGDECHNIPGIVQLQYSPTIVTEDFDKLEELYNYVNKYKELTLFNEEEFEEAQQIKFEEKSSTELRNKLLDCWQVWVDPKSRKDEDYKRLNDYLKIIQQFAPVSAQIQSDVALKKFNKVNITAEDKKYFKISSWYDNYMCHWNDFITAINSTGYDYLLKDITIANDDNHISVAFKCTKEDFITWLFLLKRGEYFVLMSATMGGKDAYNENMGFKYDKLKEEKYKNIKSVDEIPLEGNEYTLIRVPSIFDFSKSPIYFFNKFKMNYKERELTFKRLSPIIYGLCEKDYANERGMIQSGSYELAKKIYDMAPKHIQDRMLLYNGSRQKDFMVQIHKMSTNTILVGPTLHEGIDLPGEMCRFIFILKVPYPSLADKLIKEKCKLYPLWYNSNTSNRIIQGVGRGVRFNGDYCITYILDACFWGLYKSTLEQYPEEFQNRLKII